VAGGVAAARIFNHLEQFRDLRATRGAGRWWTGGAEESVEEEDIRLLQIKRPFGASLDFRLF
jgi:hypothetical protein